jgi:hypothetical protein
MVSDKLLPAKTIAVMCEIFEPCLVPCGLAIPNIKKIEIHWNIV